MTIITRKLQGETIDIIETALPISGTGTADVSSVSALPVAVMRRADARTLLPDPAAPAIAFAVTFEAAANGNPPRWLCRLEGAATAALAAGVYAFNTRWTLGGGTIEKTAHSIIQIEGSAA